MPEDRPRQANPFLARIAFLGNLGHYVFPIGAIALVSVPAVLVYQLLHYMDHGSWPTLTFADGLGFVGLERPSFDIAAVQQANEHLLESPLWLVLLFGIGGALFLYSRFSK